MRTLDKPSTVFAGLLVAFLAAVVLLGFGAPGTASTSRADAAVTTVAPAVPTGGTVTTATMCAFNMSWDGSHCR